MRRNLYLPCVLLAVLLHAACAMAQTVYHVDDDAAVGGDGLTWPTAFACLQDALAIAIEGDEIHIAQGTYTPDVSEHSHATPGDRTATFTLVSGTAVRGGYRGVEGEGLPDDRDIKLFETVLSGDLNGDDKYGFVHVTDNSFVIVTGNNLNNATILEGVTLTGGSDVGTWQAELDMRGVALDITDSDLTVQECRIQGNQVSLLTSMHGAVSVIGGNATFVGTRITHNDAGVLNDGSISFAHCSLSYNHTYGLLAYGRAVTTLRNCILHGNGTTGIEPRYCGALTIDGCTIADSPICIGYAGVGPVVVTNSILWGGHIGLIPLPDQTTVTYSCVEGGFEGEGNISADPKLVAQGVHIQHDSPCINAGDPNSEPGGFDCDGEVRIHAGRIDMGADEFVDEDNNALPDAWERDVCSETGGCDPFADEDNDGLSTTQEYGENRDPHRAPQVWHVHPEGNDLWDGLAAAWDGTHGPKRTIRAAITAAGAHEGDQILLANGVYSGEGNRNLGFMGKTLTLRSEGGPSQCTIDCQQQGRGFYFDADSMPGCTLEGVAIQHGALVGSDGAGICCKGANVLIRDCIIRESAVEGGFGAGIGLFESHAHVTNCIIEDNSNTYGQDYLIGAPGAVACSGLVELTGCVIRNNTAQGRGACGGVYAGYQTTLSNCVISGNSATGYENIPAAGGGVQCDSPLPVLISGCTITDNVVHGGYGGGVGMYYGGSMLIDNCVISGNSADEGGGGVVAQGPYFGSQSTPIIMNSTISDNVAGLNGESGCSGGGGILSDENCHITIDNCTIANNVAHMGMYQRGGGGVGIGFQGELTMTRCDVIGNTVTASSAGEFEGIGGGIAIAWQAPATITDCRIMDNTAASAGGGISCLYTTHIARCLISGNNVVGSYGASTSGWLGEQGQAVYGDISMNNRGGGIATNGDGTTIDGCTIIGNTASGAVFGGIGGGLFAPGDGTISDTLIVGNRALPGSNDWADGGDGGGVVLGGGDLRLVNCTISNNRAASDAAGMYFYSSSPALVENSILWGNAPAEIGAYTGANFAVNHSTVSGGWPGTGNITQNPRFLDPGYWHDNGTPDDEADDYFVPGDYRVVPQSPCVDAGDPSFVPEVGQTDLTGHARVLCGRVDMGAYEAGIGDMDCDSDVGLPDYSAWTLCFTGPGNDDMEPYADSCVPLDFDFDGDIDLEDYAGFQHVLTP